MRHRRTALRQAPLALALTLAVTVGACSASGPTAPDGPSSPRTRTTSPGDLCASVVLAWARDVYDGRRDVYGDYQHMGLSYGQYEILRGALSAGRAERKRHGAAAGRTVMTRQVREKCRARYRGGSPTGNPW
ncbi:hypothetical protein [Streptomyces sp. G45]|uniref:hypothetical protein n=1 Tax=Streptomyces sp. G45 TaxID=3406627 RepID=UPI003C20E714